MTSTWNEKYHLWTKGGESDLELHCLSKGYSTSKPIDVRDSNLAFVAFNEGYAIIFLYRKTIGIGSAELEYRRSYPEHKFYRKIIGGLKQ